MRQIILATVAGMVLLNCGQPGKSGQDDSQTASDQSTDTLKYEQEKHLANVTQLTFGGDNAEAYWSFDQSKLIFQATNEEWNAPCDQIYLYDLSTPLTPGDVPKRISTGKGRTTCAYFMPGDTTILYASTHLEHDTCPPVPEREPGGKYVWPIYEAFDIFVADLEGNIIKQITNSPGYDAEATVSPKGDKIIFTSTRSGDLELYTMDPDGKNVRQITNSLGYDGGAFFSPDGSMIVWRASRPETEEEIATYKELLAQGEVEPTHMELYVAHSDGTNARKITNLGNANWAPFFHPSGEKIIFCSNHESERGFPFNLYMINLDGSGLEQITYDEAFDSFPMFSPDGRKLVFASNRNNGGTRNTNLFIADWVE